MQGNLDDGITISHYILGKTIGKGGFAKVKQATHNTTNTSVAIKILNKAKMKNINMVSKVTREVKILKFLNHPNIIKLYQVMDSTSDIFIVMQMASGGQLYEYIQKNNLTQNQIKTFFNQILDGVQYAHLKLVTHRDLKPQNILLDHNHNIKIADFGLSNLMKDGKLLKTSCGSLNYAAPEIIGNRQYEGTAVDIWSCGVILYSMLTGSLPFDQQIVSVLYNKIQTAQYTIPDFVSPMAIDLLHRILQVNPCKRLSIHQIKLHPWLKNKLPIYMKVSLFQPRFLNENVQIDDQIFNIIKFSNSESLQAINDDQRIKSIIKRKLDDSFVVAYELLKSKKDENEYFQRQKRIQNRQMNIFELLQNKKGDEQEQIIDKKSFFGKKYKIFSKQCVDVILKAFKQMQITYILKNNQYCFLCQTILKRQNSMQIQKHKPRYYDIKTYGYRQETKFNKTSFKFTLQVYTISKRPSQLLIDLKLTQGHPIIFMKFSKEFYDILQKNIEQQG